MIGYCRDLILILIFDGCYSILMIFDCSAGSGLPSQEASGGHHALAYAHVATGGGSGEFGVSAVLSGGAQAPPGLPSASQPRPWSVPGAPLPVTSSAAAATGHLAGSCFPLYLPNLALVRIRSLRSIVAET
jgi:hypothetical protein